MKRNRFLVYVLISGLMAGIVLVIYVYGQYFGEDTDPGLSNGANPIISQSVNGVVTHLTANAADNPQKTSVRYTDLTTNQAATFTVDDAYQSRFHVGDTVTKDRGEKVLLVYKKDGEMTIVPVD